MQRFRRRLKNEASDSNSSSKMGFHLIHLKLTWNDEKDILLITICNSSELKDAKQSPPGVGLQY